ncbi:deaminase [Cryobacterium melibiosiphilum]|uniref:Deaminase n=1 Tax=Cryobacterium melibiosiphilum TaxID=995039 RepID=A0A3A5MQC2_9MICO|nr:dihydrofolate reductase family protein [Cryobacterium melibiosiphilum]RJT89173.1 deaminase [Cryobacterium melibiosiphilum]
MARLIYTGITSLDGYVNDAEGVFDWSMPDEEVHAFVNDLERGIGTSFYGRRLYEVMAVWETLDGADQPAVMRDYAALWKAADKVVYSTTLDAVSTSRTRLERRVDVEAIRQLKATTDADIGVGGPTLAAVFIVAGLVDEYHQFLSPVIVGGGTRFFPDGVRLDLELVGERRFGNGVVHLHYRSRA